MSDFDSAADNFRRSQLASVGAYFYLWEDMTDHYQDQWRAKYKAAWRHFSVEEVWDDAYSAGYDDATASSSDANTPNPYREDIP